MQTKRILTASELASKFSVSIRTIYRDIRAIEQAGVPIMTEEGNGYALMEHYRIVESIQVFERNKLNLPDIQTLITLSKIYDGIKQFEKAEKNLLLASEIIPNNFESRFLLVKLYDKYNFTKRPLIWLS